MRSANFQYEALSISSSIRLLTLLPAANFEAKIQCIIKEVNTHDDQPVEYEALSYVWGDPFLTKAIHICSAADAAQTFHLFDVTWNLEAALKHLRGRDKERVIWVDAICINQRDKTEKQSQVQMMGQIYTSANHIIVWLGRLVPEDDIGYIWRGKGNQVEKLTRSLSRLSDRAITGFSYGKRELFAFQWLRRLGQMHSLDGSCGEDDRPGSSDERSLRARSRILKVSADFFSSREAELKVPSVRMIHALFDLLTRQWFSRVWVIQEVVLATKQVTVQCGKETMPLETFMAAHDHVHKAELFLKLDASGDFPVSCDIIPSSKVHVLTAAYSVFRSPRFASLPVPDRVIEALLEVGFCLDTSDPHDTLYGMLGMISVSEDVSILKPDYDMPIGNLMTELVRYLIESTGTLKILQGGYGRRPPDVEKKPVRSNDVPQVCGPIVSPQVQFDVQFSDDYTVSNIPSWVPTGKVSNLSHGMIYSSSQSLRQITSFRFSENGRAINIAARNLGSISWVTSPKISLSNITPRKSKPIQDHDSKRLSHIRTHVHDAVSATRDYLLTNEAVQRRYGSDAAIIRNLVMLYSLKSEAETMDEGVKRLEKWLKSSVKFRWGTSNAEMEHTFTMRKFYYDTHYVSRFETFITSEGYIGRILWEGEDETLFRRDWKEWVVAGAADARVYYVPGCVHPLLVGRSTSQAGNGEARSEKRQIWATCAVAGFLALAEDKHIAMFEDKEIIENVWLD